VIRLLVLEEPAPRFAVCSSDSLSGGRTQNIFVFPFESAGIGVPTIFAIGLFAIGPFSIGLYAVGFYAAQQYVRTPGEEGSGL